MTATAATTARPARCAIAWATKDAIFVEIPCSQPGQPPYIARYPKTERGLIGALNILIEHEEAAPRSIPTSHPAITKPKIERAPWATDRQRQVMRELLIKRGIIKT